MVGSYIYVNFDLNREEVVNTRTVYNILDFLGDNGGLFDGLCYVAQAIFAVLSIVETNPTLIYLVSKVYNLDEEQE